MLRGRYRKWINYDERLYKNYHQTRAPSGPVGALWMDAIRRHLGQDGNLTILDLGCGTGHFSLLLARRFRAAVIGVEPSNRMRAVAQRESPHPNVSYMQGEAERIPLENRSCDFAWLSMVLHHVSDLERCARELWRVLKIDGLVFVRNGFKGRFTKARFYDFFPTARQVDEARLGDVDAVRNGFERNGFRFVACETLEEEVDRSLKDHVARIRQRPLSTFEMVPEAEFEHGIGLMEQAARRESDHRPITWEVDLLIMQRAGAGIVPQGP